MLKEFEKPNWIEVYFRSTIVSVKLTNNSPSNQYTIKTLSFECLRSDLSSSLSDVDQKAVPAEIQVGVVKNQ